MKIGYRTLKTVIAATLSIIIGQGIGLENYTVAPIIAILSIQSTKQRSYELALIRMSSSFIAIIISAMLFLTLGYSGLVFGLFLLIFIPIAARLKFEEGVVVATVIVTHFYFGQKVTVELLVNEVMIILIGIGVALLVNLYYPNQEKQVRSMQRKLDEDIRNLLIEMVNVMGRGTDSTFSYYLHTMNEHLQEAQSLATLHAGNVLSGRSSYFNEYFGMREKQYYILKEMSTFFPAIRDQYVQTEMVKNLIEEIAVSFHEDNNPIEQTHSLLELQRTFKTMPLPETRDEFESRAALRGLLHYLEHFLKVKQQFMLRQEHAYDYKN
ncbi:MAG: aromatic acid exporter family protein [Bacilli bacterium]